MARALVALLACAWAAWAAGADRYGDYAAARMPQYGAGEASRDALTLDEDMDRSPDALPPFDYKYEEDLRDRKDNAQMKVDDGSWYKANKKFKGPSFHDDETEGREDELVTKFKANRRNRKHRTRTKSKNFDADSGRRASKYSRSRNIDKDDVDIRNDYYVNMSYKHDHNSIDSDHFDFDDTTQKVIRRKPRDRSVHRRRFGNHEMEDDPTSFGTEDDNEDFNNSSEENRRAAARPHSMPDISKMKYKDTQHEYYDDLKRISDMKSRLPGLFRKTQASAAQTPRVRRLQDIAVTHQRASVPESANVTTTKTETNAETSAITRTSEEYVISNSVKSTVLSMAEKSKLSILQKAQRKANVRNVTWTTKPPVLMQVTRGMQTLVMVESQPDVRFRAREVSDDSPERVARAKKIMRRKLVAGARRIQDLVDNWDEMICDYIDVSSLESDATSSAKLYSHCLFLCVIVSCSYSVTI